MLYDASNALKEKIALVQQTKNFRNPNKPNFYCDILNIKEDQWYYYRNNRQMPMIALNAFKHSGLNIEAWVCDHEQGEYSEGLFDVYNPDGDCWNAYDWNGEKVCVQDQDILYIRIRPNRQPRNIKELKQ